MEAVAGRKSAAARAMSAQVRHEWVDCGGVKLHCAVAGDAGRPLMLFLHGFPEFWAAWRKPMAHFVAARLAVRGARPARLQPFRQARGRGSLQGEAPDRRRARARRALRGRASSRSSRTTGAARWPGAWRSAIRNGSSAW